jgi:hypothetical protein
MKKARNPGIARQRPCLAIRAHSSAHAKQQICVSVRKKRNQSLTNLRRLRRKSRFRPSRGPIRQDVSSSNIDAAVEIRPVSPKINSSKYNEPDCVDPLVA